jgi:NAD(P)H-dependent flavin oxidoreductase YrpB (nitropropane dioxygenase family)
VDGVIAVGTEGGGHVGRDEITTLVLTRHVVKAVPIPVVATGGIGDGHGWLAACALGAEGIQMGTRFLATKECPIPDAYKHAILEARDNSTVIATRRGYRITRTSDWKKLWSMKKPLRKFVGIRKTVKKE